MSKFAPGLRRSAHAAQSCAGYPLLAGGFVYWQVGRYAAPQVPVTLFDEKREVYAFVIGLFMGPWLYVKSRRNLRRSPQLQS